MGAPAQVDAVAAPAMLTVGRCTTVTVVLFVAFARQAGWALSIAIRVTAKEPGHAAVDLMHVTFVGTTESNRGSDNNKYMHMAC